MFYISFTGVWHKKSFMIDKKICLIVNPIAGQAHWEVIKYQYLMDIFEFFSQKKIPITIKTTAKRGDGKLLAEESVRQEYDYIVACGGDGTINEVVNGLVGSGATLGIIPLGTENILANAMNIPIDIKEACRHFLVAREKTWDLGVANGKHFLITSGIGLDGQVVSQMQMEPKLKKAMGSLGFILKGAEVLFKENRKREGIYTKIRFLDKNTEFNSYTRLIVVGNLSQYGASLKLALKAKPDDGKLDIAVFPNPEDDIELVEKLLEIFTETHLESGDVSYFTSTDFEITTDPPVYCQIDGELHGKTPVRYSVKPLSIKVKF